MTAKKVEESQITMTEIVLPHHTNAIGTVFGGTVMSWVDTAAAACGLRHCQKQVVTASIDAMHFLAPIKLGWIVTIKASVNYTSKTSCEVGVKVMAENPLTNEFNHTASAYATMVALDSNGRPTPIPELLLESDLEKHRWEAAIKRRESRLKLKKDIQNRKSQK